MTISVVALDGGETLFDETRTWSIWADWLGVPPFTLFVTLGGILERGRPFSDVFQLFKDSFDLDGEIAKRAEAGVPHVFRAEDLYPDVVPALTALQERGYRVVVAGNMTPTGEMAVRDIGLPVDEVISSSKLTTNNRDVRFFERLAEHLGVEAGGLVYVTHRLDTALPAAGRAGVRALYLVRGPIAYLLLGSEPDRLVQARIQHLTELPEAIETLSASLE